MNQSVAYYDDFITQKLRGIRKVHGIFHLTFIEEQSENSSHS